MYTNEQSDRPTHDYCGKEESRQTDVPKPLQRREQSAGRHKRVLIVYTDAPLASAYRCDCPMCGES